MKNKMMKIKTILVLFVGLISMMTFGQEEFGSYNSSYVNKSYEVSVAQKERGGYSVYVDMMSLDNLSNKGGIIITEKQHSKFISVLNDAKGKLVEWAATATENDVKDVNKAMPYKTKVDAYFKYGSKWNFQFSINLTFDFTVIGGESLLIVRTGKLVSSSNRYMTHDGFIFAFKDENEIDEFLDMISVDKVAEYINKPKATDLFKD